jgi:hypothetical protein
LLKAFKQRLYRHGPPSAFTNNARLSRTELLLLKQRWTETTTDLRWRVTDLALALARAKVKPMGADAKLGADMARGDVAAVAHGLRRLYRKGVFKDASPQLIMALDSLSALCSPNRGARPMRCTRDLVAVLHAESGPACVRLGAATWHLEVRRLPSAG